MLERHKALKTRIRTGEPTIGLFVRTPAHHVVELLGTTGLDFLVLDAEHAPFGIEALDRCQLAAKAAEIPALVRVAGSDPNTILSTLDVGSAGIMVPHIMSAKAAQDAVAASHYFGGKRGFSASHRSADYGAIPARDYLAASDESVTILGQIEDAEGVENIEEIVSIEGLDAVFIGRADLSMALGASSITDAAVTDAVGLVCRAAKNAGRTVGMHLPSLEEVANFRDMGVSLFTVSTEQTLLANSAGALANSWHAMTS